MATNQIVLETTASTAVVEEAFKECFFKEPKLADRLRHVMDEVITVRASIRWRPTSVEGADTAAEVVSARGVWGMVSEKAGSPLPGVICAMSFESAQPPTRAHLWVVRGHSRTFRAGTKEDSIVKLYGTGIANTLKARGYSASVTKLR